MISCGAGVDVARIDLKDPDPVDAANCDTIGRGAVNERAYVQMKRIRRSHGRVEVELSCPRKNDRPWTGNVKADEKAVHYSIQRGPTRTVPVGTSTRPGRPVTVTSVERGSFGDKTVVRHVRPG